MSNVTLEEIALACARAFGVTVQGMKEVNWKSGTGTKTPPPEMTARNAAIWIARKHTRHLYRDIAESLGLSSKQNGRAAQRAAESFDLRLATGKLDEIIEDIEDEIDALHEARSGGVSKVTLEDIAAACAREFGVTLEDMQRGYQNSGQREVLAATARNTAMWFAKTYTVHATREIYAFFGMDQRNYASQCIRKIAERIYFEPEFSERVARIKDNLKSHEARTDRAFKDDGRAAA